MTQVLAADSRFLALELYRILKDFDVARWRHDRAPVLHERLSRVGDRLPRLVDQARTTAPHTDLPSRLQTLTELVRDRTPHPHWPSQEELAARWSEYRAQLIAAYEDLARSLRGLSVHVPSVRPTNYARSVFHVAMAGVAVAIIALVPSRFALIAFAAFFATSAWTMELVRRLRPGANEVLLDVFRLVAHPHERYRVNSATWYATALLILSLTVPLSVGMLAAGILGLADPAAALVGRRFGRVRLVHCRSLEGSLTFVAVGTVTAAVLLTGFRGFSWSAALPVAAVAALFAGVAELFSRTLDDNLSIPLAAGAGAQLALALLPLL